MTPSQEERLAKAFVELADTPATDLDVSGRLRLLVRRVAELPGVDAAGLVLSDRDGRLTAVGEPAGDAHALDLVQVRAGEGPCVECVGAGSPVAEDDLRRAGRRWPAFTPAARAAGYASVHALPMRLRGELLGAVALFRRHPGRPDEAQLRIASCLVRVATIGIVRERAVRSAELLAAQLQTALSSRVVIEQAKGMLAERFGAGVDQGFTALRRYARDHNRRLTDVARDVVEGAADIRVEAPGAARPVGPCDGGEPAGSGGAVGGTAAPRATAARGPAVPRPPAEG